MFVRCFCAFLMIEWIAAFDHDEGKQNQKREFDDFDVIQQIKDQHFSYDLTLQDETPIPLNLSAVVDELHPCPFVAESCFMEAIEHRIVDKFINPDDIVLELGARYGTTSCAIAAKQKNSGKLVSVEPDSTVWDALELNRLEHKCNFWIFKGMVTNKYERSIQHITGKEDRGYGTRFYPDAADATNTTVSGNNDKTSMIGSFHLNLHQLQHIMQMKFNVLLIDCEGCINFLLPHHGHANHRLAHTLRHVHTIILEADMGLNAPDCTSHCVDYTYWVDKLEEVGFTQVHRETDPKFKFIDHFVFQRAYV